MLYFAMFESKLHIINFHLLSYFTFEALVQTPSCHAPEVLLLSKIHTQVDHHFVCKQEQVCFSTSVLVYSFLMSHCCINLSASQLGLLLMLPTFHLVNLIGLLLYHVVSYLML